MAIECYEAKCPYHATNCTDEEGPFCFEEKCRKPLKELDDD